MHVLLVASNPFDARGFVGPPYFVRNLVEGLRSVSDCRVSILCLGSGRHDTAEHDGVMLYRVAEPPHFRTLLTPLLSAPACRSIVRELAPDVIDLHMPERYGLVHGLGIPLAITIHGLLPEQLRHGLIPRHKYPLSLLYRRQWIRGLNSADALLALSAYDKEYLRRITSTPAAVVPVPRSAGYFTEKKEARDTVLSVGGFCPRKNHFEVVSALALVRASVPGVRATIVGGLDEGNGRDSMRRLLGHIDSLGMSGHISLRANMPHEEVIEAYRRAAVYVQYSTQESYPGAVVEAFAASTPVVVSDIPAMREAVRDRCTGFLVPLHDTRRLAERISFLLTHDDTRASMGENAGAFARRNFLSGVAAGRILDVYRGIARGHS